MKNRRLLPTTGIFINPGQRTNAPAGGRGNRVELAITSKGRKQIEKRAPARRSAQSAAEKTLGEKRWSAILSDLKRRRWL